MSFSIAGHRHRVDRIHLITSCDQRLHLRTTIGLYPDSHMCRGLGRIKATASNGSGPTTADVRKGAASSKIHSQESTAPSLSAACACVSRRVKRVVPGRFSRWKHVR